MNLVQLALRRPMTIVVIVIAVALGAWLSLQKMSRDIFPPLGIPTIYVAQPYGGMDPAQMEGYLTYYYEYHFLYITGIEHVDAGALGYFERVARALRLIGAVTILAGVRPQVARDLALQGGGEQPLRAVSHVQEAIALSMASKMRVLSGPAQPLGIGSGPGRR